MKVSTILCGRAGILALAEHQGAHQAGDAGIDVHDGAAGEVEHLNASLLALLRKPSGPQTQCAIGE